MEWTLVESIQLDICAHFPTHTLVHPMSKIKEFSSIILGNLERPPTHPLMSFFLSPAGLGSCEHPQGQEEQEEAAAAAVGGEGEGHFREPQRKGARFKLAFAFCSLLRRRRLTLRSRCTTWRPRPWPPPPRPRRPRRCHPL